MKLMIETENPAVGWEIVSTILHMEVSAKEVITCKDCENWDDCLVGYCTLNDCFGWEEDDFCSKGVKK